MLCVKTVKTQIKKFQKSSRNLDYSYALVSLDLEYDESDDFALIKPVVIDVFV